jgi:hypothetical protein
VDKFSKTFAKLASSSEFSLAKSENNWPQIVQRVSEMEKNLATLANGIIFANPEFNSHLASGYLHPC